MANFYLQIEYATGKLFEYSKDKKDGFVEHTNTKGAVTYRRYFDKGLYGTLKSIEKRDSNFGEQLNVGVTDVDGNNNYISIPLFDGQNNIATYAEGFIQNLKGLQIGEDYRIFPYAIVTEDGKYTNRGISIKKANLSAQTVSDQVEKYTNSYTDKEGKKVVGDIPAVEWKQKLGKNVPDKDAKNEFLFNALANFNSVKAEVPKKAVVNTNEEDDSLPF